LQRMVDAYRERRAATAELEDARELLAAEQDPAMRDYLRVEVDEQEAKTGELEERLRELLVPSDRNAGKNVIVEIRGAEGGEEANLWAADLLHMYEGFAKRHGWKTEVLTSQPSEMGGFREVALVIKGDDAWTRLKHEAGPHRVQRVPETESQGRIHTSAATVAVLPEAEEVDVDIRPDDIRIDTMRAGGAGGQHVNKTESAVRITHLPTGVVVTCMDERSQHKNRDRAMRILRSRLFEMERERLHAERAGQRRSQVGSGDRSERVRTYNFPQNRVSDHRLGENFSLELVIQGRIDALLSKLERQDREERIR